jgi:hypothetical protein
MVAPCGRLSSASTASCFDLARELGAVGLVRFTFDRVFIPERGLQLHELYAYRETRLRVFEG